MNAIEQTSRRRRDIATPSRRRSYDFRTDGGLEQQVLRLEVAVDDASVMQIRQRIEQYADQPPRVHLVVERLFHNPLEQLAALHELDGHVIISLLVEKIIQLHDVRVVYRSQNSNFFM